MPSKYYKKSSYSVALYMDVVLDFTAQ